MYTGLCRKVNVSADKIALHYLYTSRKLKLQAGIVNDQSDLVEVNLIAMWLHTVIILSNLCLVLLVQNVNAQVLSAESCGKYELMSRYYLILLAVLTVFQPELGVFVRRRRP